MASSAFVIFFGSDSFADGEGIALYYPLVNELVDPENSLVLMETHLPTPSNPYLPGSMLTLPKFSWVKSQKFLQPSAITVVGAKEMMWSFNRQSHLLRSFCSKETCWVWKLWKLSGHPIRHIAAECNETEDQVCAIAYICTSSVSAPTISLSEPSKEWPWMALGRLGRDILDGYWIAIHLGLMCVWGWMDIRDSIPLKVTATKLSRGPTSHNKPPCIHVTVANNHLPK